MALFAVSPGDANLVGSDGVYPGLRRWPGAARSPVGGLSLGDGHSHLDGGTFQGCPPELHALTLYKSYPQRDDFFK